MLLYYKPNKRNKEQVYNMDDNTPAEVKALIDEVVSLGGYKDDDMVQSTTTSTNSSGSFVNTIYKSLGYASLASKEKT